MKIMPRENFVSEKSLWRQGYHFVAGLDEAGRGPLAGPVAAGAVVIEKSAYQKIKKYGYKDSKLLTERQRENAFEVITNFPGVWWGIGIISQVLIDEINILQATKCAMLDALSDLRDKGSPVDYLILDGNMSVHSPIPYSSVIAGDQLIYSCSLASIIAKVTRDKLMKTYDVTYPQYGFCKNKGYGTPFHLRALETYGPCAIHRKSFEPVRRLLAPLA